MAKDLARQLAEEMKRKKEEQERLDAAKTQHPHLPVASLPNDTAQYSTAIDTSVVGDNRQTLKMRNFMNPYNQAERGFTGMNGANFFGANPNIPSLKYGFTGNTDATDLMASYAEIGGMAKKLFDYGRTGKTDYQLQSYMDALASGDMAARLGINDPGVAYALSADAMNKANSAIAAGQKTKPHDLVSTYVDENAGKGYSVTNQAGDLHDFRGDVLKNAEIKKKNVQEGLYNNDELLQAGEYDLLSPDYMDMIIKDYPAKIAELGPMIDAAKSERTPYEQHWNKPWFRDLHECQTLGLPLEPEDMYQFAATMYPGETYVRADFEEYGDPEAIARVSQDVASMVAMHGNGGWEEARNNKVKQLEAQRDSLQMVLDDTKAAQGRQKEIAGFGQKYAGGDTTFHPESFLEHGASFDISDRLLYINLMGNPDGTWQKDAAAQMGREHLGTNNYDLEALNFLTPAEVGYINAEWNANHDADEVERMIDLYAPILYARQREELESREAYAADRGGLGYDIYNNTINALGTSAEGLRNFVASLAGAEGIDDPNSPYYNASNKSEFGHQWRATQAETSLPGFGEKLYGIPTGALREGTKLGVSSLLGGALGGLGFVDDAAKAAARAYEAASGVEALGSGLKEGYERGYGKFAPLYAGGSAAMAGATEHIGVDNLFKGSGKWWKTMVATGAPETIEELANMAGEGMLESGFDAASGRKFSDNDRLFLQTYMDTGSVEEAEAAVAKANREEAATTAVTSFGIGALLGAPAAYQESSAMRKRGKSVSSNSNTGALMDVAMALDEGSDARQLAETLKAQADKGKKPSNGQLGRLYATIAKDLDAKSASVVTQTMQDAIVDEMVDKGESEEVARRAAPILAKQLRGEKLTNADTSALAESKTAITMMEELNKYTEGGKEDGPKAGLFKRTRENTAQATDEQIQTAEEMLLERGDSAKAAKRAAPLLARVANGDTLTKSEQAFVDQTEGSEEIVSKLRSEKTGNKPLQRPAWVEDVETRQAVYAAPKVKDIATKGKALLDTTRPSNQTAIAKSADKAKALTVKDGAAKDGVRDTTAVPLGSKEPVDIQRIEADNDGVLKLVTKDSTGKESKTSYKTLSFKGGSVGHVITHAVDNYAGNAEMANLMYQSYTGGDSTKYIAEMDAAYRAGFDASTVNRDSMTQYKGVAKHAFELGQKQAQEAEQTRLKNIGKAKLGKGRVTIPASVDVSKLSKPQQNQIAVVRKIAEATGINFTFFESDVDALTGEYTSENGSYDPSTNSIRLDLYAGRTSRKTGQYAIVRTAAHEMTHFIEANSRENYAKMRQFIADELARKGLNFNSLVQAKIDRSRDPLTHGGAIAEVVADGCEMMLKDSEAIQRLMQKDASLGEQIKKVLKEFVGRIRKAFENIRPGSIEAKALMDEVDGVLEYADELQKLWDAGLEEAVEATSGDAETTQSAETIPATVQFELRSPVERRKNGLIAVHNINSTKLMDTLELGAFPMPSIAIVKAEQGHNSFGEYSVVFGPDTIDPKKNKTNRVYGNDAWTPVFPQVEREINSKALYRTADEVESAAGKIAEAYERDARSFFNQFAYQDATNHSDGYIQEYAWNNDGMVAAYASENGMAVEILQHDVPVNRGYNIARANQYDKILDIISAEDIGRLSGKDIFNTYGDQLAEVGRIFFNAVEAWKMGDRREAVRGLEIIKQAKAYEDAGRDAKPLTRREDDYAGTARAVRDSIDRASFNNWVMEKMSGILGQKGIRNNKDLFTPSGSRRSFKALHDAYTTENVVRAMLRQDESSISPSDARGLKAAASSMYGSLAEIRSDEERLRSVPSSEYDARLAKMDNDMREFFNFIGAWDYDDQESAGELLARAGKRNMTAAQINTLFAQNGFKAITPRFAQMAKSILEQAQSFPTGYFEAKPARVVSFDEVRMVIAPDTMPVKLAEALQERGIPYTTYDGTDSDRKAKLNEVEGVQFSLRNSNDPEVASIKDQLRKAQAELNNMAVVASVAAPDMTGWNKKKQKTWVLDNLKYTGYKVDVMDFGVIEFGEKQIDTSLDYLKREEEVAAFLALPKVLKRGMQVAGHDNHKGRQFDTVTFAAPVSINGVRGNMAVVVKKLGRNLYKTHRILMPDGSSFSYEDKKMQRRNLADGIPSETMAQVPRHNSADFSIQQRSGTVNENLKYSLRTPAPATTRDYLLSLTDADLSTAGEKDAMNRYRVMVDELRELEEKRAAQQEIAATATGDERIKAKNRADIYTVQIDRLNDRIRGKENTNVLRPIVAEAKAILEANRKLDVGRPMEEVVRQLDQRLQESLSRTEQNLVALDKQLREATAKVDKLNKNATAAAAKAMFDSKDINQRISSIKQLHGNAMSSAELSNRLALMYATYWSDLDGNGPSLAMNMAQELARDIVSRSKSHTQSWVLGAIRENLGAFSLNEKQLQELNHAGYNINSMRSVLSGVAKYSATASSLDSKWEELCAAVPSLDPTASEGDQITSLIDLISREKQTEQGFDHAPTEQFEAELLVSLLDMPTPQKAKAAGISNIKAIKAAATDSASILQELEDSAAKASNSLKNAKSANLSAGRIADEAQKAVEYYKALYEKQVAKTGSTARQAEEKLLRFREKVKQERDAREKITASRRRITKMVKYLDTLRRKESDYKHVPEELKPTVNALVAAFAEHSSMVFDSRRAERIAQAYSKLQALDNDLAAYYDPDVQARIEYIADLMELKRGKPMTLAEMEIIEDVVGAIYKMVRGSNEAFFENQMMDIAQIAADVADEMLQRKDRSYWVNSKYEDALDTLIRNGNLTPVYYFDNLNNAMLKRLGYDILGGQDKYGLYQRDDRMTMGEIRKKYNYNSWRNDKPIVHNDVQFTKEQALWVYATAKREATNELAQTHHLDEGGIVFEGGEVVGADGKKRKRTTPMRLSAKDVQAITSTLTEEQKGYADAVVQHLSTTVGERGNEVSLRMYGFRKYREQYYFPYKTASDQRHQTSVSNAVSATNDARLKHQSFSNPLKKGANTPLVLGDFTAMATGHMNAMNTYAAMVIPVENMNRVLNRKTEIDGAVTTLRGLMAQKYGDSTKRYLETLLKDLNGGAQVDNRTGGLIDKTVGMYKKGAVVVSASVVLQQWASIFRAAYMINPKYLAGATFQKRDWDELVKYSGVATIKDMGRFDVNVGVGGSNWLAADADDFNTWEKAKQMLNPRDWETFKTRWDDAVNFLPGWADRVTWAQIWNAVKAEQADQHPGMDKSGDAFLKMCADRFNDIINHTQVYDSTMTRSQLMRSKNALDKMATAFGSEPTVILNMVYDAIHNPAYKGKRKGKIGAGIATVTLSQLAAAAMQALASAWRKDDDERKALEKFLDKWSYNFIDNMNPFTMFPYLRDMWDTFTTSYDVERSDMALFSELKDALTKLNNDSYSPYRKVEELAGTLAKFGGIPLKNIMRDLRSAYNAILKTDWSVPEASSIGYTLLDNLPFRDSSKAAYYQRMENAYASGDEERADDIAQYLESNDTTADAVSAKLSGMLKRMLAAGNDAAVDAILADMAARGRERDGGDLRTIINDLYKNGEIDWQQAERLYKKHTNLTSANDLYWHKQDLDYKGEGNYSAYRAAREALLAGDKKTYLAEKSRLLTHGKKGSNVMGETVTDLKDELLALYETDITAARKLREMIVWAYMECGKTKESANKIIDGWFKD